MGRLRTRDNPRIEANESTFDYNLFTSLQSFKLLTSPGQASICIRANYVLRRDNTHRQASDPPPLTRDMDFTPPSPVELEKVFESLALLRGIVSPVFFSTRSCGQIVPGLGAVPLAEGKRPVLLVGNHQTLASDLGIMIQEFIEERGVLVRGLAHPEIMRGAAGGPDLAAMFSTFGAVPVSGKNFYKLLAASEVILLFPGGLREAIKRKNEDYRLFWPSRPEFIRMAVRHGATIVPFAAVVGALLCRASIITGSLQLVLLINQTDS